MSEELAKYEGNEVAPIADDFLLQVAAQAEQRVAAVIKIKRVALAVTNKNDWCDQDGKPYMMVSAAEKIANLFSVSWRVDEPRCEEESDGHYTYHYKGVFSLSGRSIEVEGSRSSRDKFFTKYDYSGKERAEKPVGERDNKRDVQMAAYTNLLGNGITRLLGLRNLTYDDLYEFAKIAKEDIGKVEYKKSSKPYTAAPQKKGEATTGEVQEITGLVEAVTFKEGNSKGKPWTLYTIKAADISFTTFDKKHAEYAKEAKEIEQPVKIEYTVGEKGNTLVSIKAEMGEEIPAEEGDGQ